MLVSVLGNLRAPNSGGKLSVKDMLGHSSVKNDSHTSLGLLQATLLATSWHTTALPLCRRGTKCVIIYVAFSRMLACLYLISTRCLSVSVLALEEFNTLQQKYELETQCRFEAEKYAAEVTSSLI